MRAFLQKEYFLHTLNWAFTEGTLERTEHHDDLLKKYLVNKKKYNTLCQKYFRPNIYKQVDKYCTSCLIFQEAKVIYEK